MGNIHTPTADHKNSKEHSVKDVFIPGATHVDFTNFKCITTCVPVDIGVAKEEGIECAISHCDDKYSHTNGACPFTWCS